MKTVICLTACALVALADPVRGDEPPRVTLAEALLLARQINPDLLAARADLETARAQVTTARALPNPVLSYSTTKIPTDGTPADTIYGNDFYSRSYDTVVAATQLVEIGGKRSSRRSSADEGVAAASARLADAFRLLDASVVKAYVAAAVAARTADLTRDSADALAKTVALAGDREAAGEISRAERTQVEIAGGKFRADAIQAELARGNSLRSLAALLNLPAVALAEDLSSLASAEAVPPVGDDAALVPRRPDVLALDAAVRKAEAELSLQKAFRVPDPTLLVQYEREPPDQRNTFGFGVSLPLPLFNRNTGAIHAAEVARDAARRDLGRGRVRAEQDLAATRQALEIADARSTRLAGELLPKAESVRETVRDAYQQGGASLLELLEAERNANDIRLAAATAERTVAVQTTGESRPFPCSMYGKL